MFISKSTKDRHRLMRQRISNFSRRLNGLALNLNLPFPSTQNQKSLKPDATEAGHSLTIYYNSSEIHPNYEMSNSK